jgi:hypothetical protein
MSVVTLHDSNELMKRFEDLSHQVAALSTELTHLSKYRDPRPSFRNRRSGSRSPSQDNARPNLCWYNRRYGARTQKCTQPCFCHQQEKLPHQISTEAHIPISRGTRTVSMVSPRLTSEIRNPHQPGDRNHLSTQVDQDYLPWLENRQSRRFLTILNYYRQILPHVAAHQTPLHDVISGPKVKSSHSTTWIPELHKAFKKCRASLSCTILLAHLDTFRPLALVTDAPTSTMVAMLQQRVRNTWQPLAFYHKKVNPEVKPTAAPPPPSTAQLT